MRAQSRLLSRYLPEMPPGQLDWIGLRPGYRQPVQAVQQAQAVAGFGLEGDRRRNGREGSARQITVISAEDIALVSSLLGKPVSPDILRRNLVISGINLYALRHQRVQIGEVELVMTAHCHPCLRMNEALGEGAVAAMMAHGGLCGRIINDGAISIGNEVRWLGPAED